MAMEGQSQLSGQTIKWRLLLATTVIILSLVGGKASGDAANVWLDFESGAVRGAAWGTLSAAIVALVKIVTDFHANCRSLDPWINGQEKTSDFAKPVLAMWSLAVVLSMGFHALRYLYIQVEDRPRASLSLNSPAEPLVINVIRDSERVAYITSPAVVFPSGRLRNSSALLAELKKSPVETWFSSESFTVDGNQQKMLQTLVRALLNRCANDNFDGIGISVKGFASDAKFKNGKGAEREDSSVLNYELANLRARKLKSALEDAALAVDAAPGSLQFSAHHWSSPGDMREGRDMIFRGFQITYSPSIDHRSAVITEKTPGTCQFINSAQ